MRVRHGDEKEKKERMRETLFRYSSKREEKRRATMQAPIQEPFRSPFLSHTCSLNSSAILQPLESSKKKKKLYIYSNCSPYIYIFTAWMSCEGQL